MKNRKTIIYFNHITIAVIVCFASCKKLVEIPPPADKVISSTVFSSEATATQAVFGIYGSMAIGNQVRYMSYNCGLLSDELINYKTTDFGAQALYQNAMSANDDAGKRIWGPGSTAYTFIYRSNDIIEGLQKSTSVNEKIKMQLAGEAKFIRAFWHFYLTNCYGDVPLALTTDYTINAVLPRSPKADVLKQIIKDLQEARDAMSGSYLDATDTVVINERLRPNSWAARALIARAFLYAGQPDSAIAEATAVINNTTDYSLVTDLNKVFLANSREAIWQIAPPLPRTYNTLEGQMYVMFSGPTGNGNAGVGISTQLLSAFEAGDNRKMTWIGTYVSGANTYYYPYKYKVRVSPDPNNLSEYTMVLRLAEQYLIRAEARAVKNDLAGAVADLNFIRNRAGLANYSGAMSQSAILAAILHERQVELFVEWGHRWFDLARTGTINSVMSVVTPLKGGVWNPSGYQQLFPIPQSEINADYRLTQNPGY